VEIISSEGWHSLSLAQFWVIAAVVVGTGVVYFVQLTDMLANFEAVLIVPLFQCFFILLLVVYSNFFFLEMDDIAWERVMVRCTLAPPLSR
jgi:hypothetical protein